MVPAGKPAKSAASHPLVQVFAEPELQVDRGHDGGDVAVAGAGERTGRVGGVDGGQLLERGRADDR